jgi:MOSC domain-containing protein YiiM
MTELSDIRHLGADELEAGLAAVAESPRGAGTLELVVRRPAVDVRDVVEEAVLDPEQGVVGDDWTRRGSTATPDGGPHRGRQLTLMNSRFVALVAGDRDRWALAGDQLFVDLDLSVEALPVGSRLAVGSAVIEMTDQDHTGCVKFADRYGRDAHKLVWSPRGRALRLRGAYAQVVLRGVVRPGDPIRVLDPG